MSFSIVNRGVRLTETDFYETLVEGQTVRLITGSAPMVIIDVCGDCGDVTVAYGTSEGDIDVLTVPPTAVELDE